MINCLVGCERKPNSAGGHDRRTSCNTDRVSPPRWYDRMMTIDRERFIRFTEQGLRLSILFTVFFMPISESAKNIGFASALTMWVLTTVGRRRFDMRIGYSHIEVNFRPKILRLSCYHICACKTRRN